MSQRDVGTLEVQEVACNLCGRRDAVPIAANCGLGVVRCLGCGLIFVNPQPTEAAIRAYHEAQDLMMREGWSSYFEHYPRQLKELWDERIEDLSHWTPTREVNLLDVGCGPGEFLHFARQRGWHATGFEFAPTVADLARKNYGLDVKVGDLATLKYARHSFTILSMWHVLEHLRDPLAALKLAEQILAPAGLLVLEVPNVNCIWRRSYRYPLSAILHLFHFSPSTLVALVRRAGFEVVSCRHGNTGALYSSKGKILLKRTLCAATNWMDHYLSVNVGNSIRLYARKNVSAMAAEGAEI